MAIRIVRLGDPRAPGEGTRLGTVRRPPRGVPRSDFAKRDYYDTWLPMLSPSQPLVTLALEAAKAHDTKAWATFSRKYRAEMKEPAAGQVLDLLAAMSHESSFSVGCYCEDEAWCHRGILRDLLVERNAAVDA